MRFLFDKILIKILLIGVTLLVTVSGFSQNRKIDSLKAVLEATPYGIKKVQLLHELSIACENSTPETGLQYAIESLTLSESLKDSLLIAFSLARVGFGHLTLSNYPRALEKFYQAQSIYESKKDRAGIAEIKNYIGNLYSIMERFDDALLYFRESLTIYQEIGDSLNRPREYGNIGIMLLRLKNYSEALGYLTKAYKLHENMNQLGSMAVMLTFIAITYQERGDIDNSLSANLKAIEQLRKGLGNEKFLAIALQNAGIIYTQKKVFPKAAAYLKESMEIAVKGGFREQERDAILAISKMHAAEGKFNLAYEKLLEYQSLKELLFNRGSASQIEKLQNDAIEVKNAQEIARLQQESTIQKLELEQFNFTRKVGIIFLALLIVVAALGVNRYYIKQRSEKELREKNNLLHKQAEELDRLARTDVLTGIANRRAFDELLELEFGIAKRYKHVLSVAISDIDFFKKINDNFSHEMGDQALKAIAQVFKQNCRKTDTVARYGGEEFVFLFPNTGSDQARMVCEKIRQAVASYPWSTLHPELKVTVSIGICSDVTKENALDMIAAADEKLYEAKHNGRNQVRM
ncbi:MAG: tetratricopeptide repeat-containing diguanylate cyclase [Chloroherpetonaceae bacterium]|nr:tetratricopeptide repeat-containing diguanylate cyclase [Chloroherpetonaceae bacterium]